MRAIVAFAAALVVNVGAFGALDWDVHEEQVAPPGTVLVRQLPEPGERSMYADVSTYEKAKSL